MDWFKKRKARRKLFNEILDNSNNNYKIDPELKKILKIIIFKKSIFKFHHFNSQGEPIKELFFNFDFVKRNFNREKVLLVIDDIAGFT